MARNKDRLYITLHHRFAQPGYHWAFVYGPKDPTRRGTEDNDSTRWDSTRWDLTNPQPNRWESRSTQIDQWTSVTLIARVLLAKFDAKNRVSNKAWLEGKIRQVVIRQNDPTFTCRVWTLDAARALIDQNIIRLSIPYDELEDRARAHADNCMARTTDGSLVIEDQSDIPVLDLRRS